MRAETYETWEFLHPVGAAGLEHEVCFPSPEMLSGECSDLHLLLLISGACCSVFCALLLLLGFWKSTINAMSAEVYDNASWKAMAKGHAGER